MKTIAYAIAAFCVLSTPVLANDRTEDGTAASRHVAELAQGATYESADTNAITTTSAVSPYVNPAGTEPFEVLYRRYSTGNGNGDDFLTIKRQGIELDGHNE